jgi:hypothetical protein
VEFSTWLAAVPWPPPSLAALIKDARERLADINREQRRMIERAGLEAPEEAYADAVVACWTEGPHILVFESTGSYQECPPGGFVAVGTGGEHAFVAFETLSTIEGRPAIPAISPLEKFRAAVATASRTAEVCDPPAHIWRVTAHSVERLPDDPRPPRR